MPVLRRYLAAQSGPRRVCYRHFVECEPDVEVGMGRHQQVAHDHVVSGCHDVALSAQLRDLAGAVAAPGCFGAYYDVGMLLSEQSRDFLQRDR